MAVKKKAPVAAPKNYEAANAVYVDYLDVRASLEKEEARLAAAVRRITDRVEARALPLKEQLKDLSAQLEAYADENRDALTDKGKVKFHDMPAGRVGWRSAPPSVTWKRGMKADDIVAGIKALVARLMPRGTHPTDGDALKSFQQRTIAETFIRTKEEPNKEAMLEHSDLALLVEGVKIGSAGETFYLEPVGGKLSEGAA